MPEREWRSMASFLRQAEEFGGPVEAYIAKGHWTFEGGAFWRPKTPGLCGCIRCQQARTEQQQHGDNQLRERLAPGILAPLPNTRPGPDQPGWRYACELCGCKRCPHHSDHRLACTGSNCPGQTGSIFT